MSETPTLERYEDYRQLKKQFPGCGYISGDWREGPRSAAIRILMRHISGHPSPGPRLLDVGAADRGLCEVLAGLGFSGDYLSADTNELDHDYSHFLSVEDRFDYIVMFELIEHLPLETGMAFIRHAHKLLNPGGLLVLSTPNADHPVQFWSSDITHIRPWPADSLWAILRQSGFGNVVIYRQHMEGVSRNAWRHLVRKGILFPVQRLLSRILDFDYAQNIVAFSEKREHDHNN